MKRAAVLATLLAGGAAFAAGGASLSGGLDLGWLAGERGNLLAALGVTAGRLLLGLLLGLSGGALLAGVMRRSARLEALFTPWLLLLLAVPWLLILVTFNIVPGLGVREGTGVALTAVASGVQIFALGRRRLEEARSAYLRRALWYAFTAVGLGELLARTDGLGARIRFYALFTQPDHLALYVLGALLLWLAFAGLGRVLLAALPRTFLGRSA